MSLLVFVSPSGDPQLVVLSTLLLFVLVTVGIQVYYVIYRLKEYAKSHGLTTSTFIKMKLSREELERQRLDKLAQRKRMDALYRKIREIKK